MRERSDRGSVTVFTTIITVALIFVAGLVIDGGAILNARRDAANVAESAARAGAQELDEDAARRDGATLIDPSRAIARAEAFLAAIGVTGTVTATQTQVSVTVEVHEPLQILGIGGLGGVDITGTGTATPQRPIRGGTP